MYRNGSIAFLVAGLLLGSAVCSPSTAEVREKDAPTDKTPDVVYVPTPHDVVDKMLELAKVHKDDVLYDLGSGDGRIVVTAAKKYGCRGIGFEIDPEQVAQSRANIRKAGVADLATIKQQDIFTLDLRPASVVTLYLLPGLNVKLIPQLEKLKPGARVVTHDFDIDGITPHQVVRFTSKEDGVKHTVYLYTVPLKKTKQ